MPGYQGHLIGGLIASNVLLAALACTGVVYPTPLGCVEWFAVGLLGSLFPDIDIKSKGQKIFYWLLFFLYIYLFKQRHLMILGILSIISITPMLVKHRGIFHRWWFVAMMPMAVAFIASYHCPQYTGMIFCDTLFFVVGALSHLMLDFGFKRAFKL